MTRTIKVRVASNSSYMRDDDTFELPPFGSLEKAIAECKRIVDDYLASAYEPGMSSEALYRSYTMFGDDPYIISNEEGEPEEGEPFSAWEYAKERAAYVAGGAEVRMETGGAR